MEKSGARPYRSVLYIPASRERALEKAAAIGRMGPLAVRLTKEVVRRGRDMGIYGALELERVAFRRVMLSDDADEGVAAFVERRTPKYNGC